MYVSGFVRWNQFGLYHLFSCVELPRTLFFERCYSCGFVGLGDRGSSFVGDGSSAFFTLSVSFFREVDDLVSSITFMVEGFLLPSNTFIDEDFLLLLSSSSLC